MTKHTLIPKSFIKKEKEKKKWGRFKVKRQGELGCDPEYSGQGGCLALRPFLLLLPLLGPLHPDIFVDFSKLRCQLKCPLSETPCLILPHELATSRHYLTTFCDGTIWGYIFHVFIYFVWNPWTINPVKPVSTSLLSWLLCWKCCLAYSRYSTNMRVTKSPTQLKWPSMHTRRFLLNGNKMKSKISETQK